MNKTVKPIPDGYNSVTAYLIVKGASEALSFYKKALGAEELFRLKMSGAIGHAEFMIGSSRIMIADEFPDMKVLGPISLGGSTVSFMIYVSDVDKSSEAAIKAGMKVKRPIENHFYGDRSITLEDPFGHVWTLSTHVEDVPVDEMKKRMAALYGGKN